MNKVGKCYLPSIVQGNISASFSMKIVRTIPNKIWSKDSKYVPIFTLASVVNELSSNL